MTYSECELCGKARIAHFPRSSEIVGFCMSTNTGRLRPVPAWRRSGADDAVLTHSHHQQPEMTPWARAFMTHPTFSQLHLRRSANWQ